MTSYAPIRSYPALTCAALLTVSNLFMTFAWYGHLKNLQEQPLWIAALCLLAAVYFIFRD